MNDADELAQRYLTLWTQYLTALLANPQAMETLKRWLSFAGTFAYPQPEAKQPGIPPLPAWPPFFGPFGLPPAPPADSSPKLAELAQRIDELECRLEALEQKLRSGASRRVSAKRRQEDRR